MDRSVQGTAFTDQMGMLTWVLLLITETISESLPEGAFRGDVIVCGSQVYAFIPETGVTEESDQPSAQV